MPFMDGLVASSRIAKSSPHVAIFIYTIYKSEYLDSEAKKAGVRAVISKIDPKSVVQRSCLL